MAQGQVDGFRFGMCTLRGPDQRRTRLLREILEGALHEQFAGGDGARFAAVVALRQGELRGSIAAGHTDYIANERQGRTLGEVAMDELTAVQVLQLEDHDALSCTIQARAACEP